jgi:hypothetical protein
MGGASTRFRGNFVTGNGFRAVIGSRATPGRTRKADFETCASADSATPASGAAQPNPARRRVNSARAASTRQRAWRGSSVVLLMR